jgi:hypothetical protein
MPLKIGEGLLRETFTILRECGQYKNECVVYWAGPVAAPQVVDRVLHPIHSATPGFYEIDQKWLNGIWFKLNEEGIAIRAQVHTHRGAAFHSRLDDLYPLMQTAGFVSLVIPHFAREPVGLQGAYLAELRPGGRWHALDASRDLEVAR